jgi:hypothetical protein
MIEALGQERRESFFAGVTAGTVTAVVAKGDRFCQSDVQPARTRDRRRDLSDFESMGEPRPLVVGREDEDLCLARQAPKGSRMHDPVPIPLEAGPPRVGCLLERAAARPG